MKHSCCLTSQPIASLLVRIAMLICIVPAILLSSENAIAKTRWETYLSLPTPQNASMVTAIEYTPGVIPEKSGYWVPDLAILRNQVLDGDAEAFRLSYRLFEKADGGLAEDLAVILSYTIRAHPEFFLRELSALQPSDRNLESILLMLGTEYTDRLEAQRYEMRMRIGALESVKIKSLQIFRNRCLKATKGAQARGGYVD